MTNLKWLTLREHLPHYLNDAEASDGTLVIEFSMEPGQETKGT